MTLLIGCSGGTGAPGAEPARPSPGATFNQPSMVIDHLEAPVRPPYAAGSLPSAELVKSSDPSIVSVDAAGNLIGHRSGEATVRAGGSSQLKVVVVGAQRLEIVPGRLSLAPGEKREVVCQADGTPLSLDAVRWETSNPDIAAAFGLTVQAGLAPGAATLTAFAGEKRAILEVKVDAPPARLKLLPASLRMPIGAVEQFRATGVPDQAVTWASSNPQVLVSLPGGRFLAKSAGSARACAAHGAARFCSAVTVAP